MAYSSPIRAKVQRLVDWLKKQGFEISKITQDKTGVYTRIRSPSCKRALRSKWCESR